MKVNVEFVIISLIFYTSHFPSCAKYLYKCDSIQCVGYYSVYYILVIFFTRICFRIYCLLCGFYIFSAKISFIFRNSL